MKWSTESVAKIINESGFIPAELEWDVVNEMLQRGNIATYDRGEFVTRRGDGHPRLCVVLKGYVRLTAFTEDGKEMLSHFIQPGDCWGVHPCLGELDEANDGITEVTSDVLVISSAEVHELMWKFRSFQQAMVKVLCNRLKLAVRVASQLGVQSSAQRLAWRLSMLSQSTHKSHHGPVHILVSQESLASMIGLTRQRTNFLLRELEKEGVITLRYNKIEIVNPDRLKTLASTAI